MRKLVTQLELLVKCCDVQIKRDIKNIGREMYSLTLIVLDHVAEATCLAKVVVRRNKEGNVEGGRWGTHRVQMGGGRKMLEREEQYECAKTRWF